MKTSVPVRTISHVARRAAIVLRDVPIAGNPQIHHTSGGVLTARDLARMLEPEVGQLRGIVFHRSLRGENVVEFEGRSGIAHNVGIVRGRVILHAAVKDDAVITWAVVTVERGCP